jgi:hypothetical protein
MGATMAKDDDRETIAFTVQETETARVVAEWFANVCREKGRPVPPDVMRALLSLGVQCMLASKMAGADMPNYGTGRTGHTKH